MLKSWVPTTFSSYKTCFCQLYTSRPVKGFQVFTCQGPVPANNCGEHIVTQCCDDMAPMCDVIILSAAVDKERPFV